MADLHKLDKTELIRLLRDSQQALASDEREEKSLLHDLQVHQIELELQNRELREAQSALELARDRYADLYDFAPVGYLTLDDRGVITETNLTASALLKMPRQELVGRPFASYVAKESKPLFYKHLSKSREQVGHDNVVTEIELQPRVNNPIQVRLESCASATDDGKPINHMMVMDITVQKKAEQQDHLANIVLENTSEGVMITDHELNIIRINPAFTETTGYSSDEALGQKPRMLQSGRHDQAFYREMWSSLQNEGKWSGEIWNRRKNGEIYPEWLIISKIRNASGNVAHYMGVFNDITSQMHIRERLHRLAYYDPVTELGNRELLQDKFHTLLSLSKRHNNLLGLLFLDLDQFKQVNDTLGHMIGDELLKETAIRLLGCVREADIVARLGGDEFIVLLTDLQHQNEIEIVASKIIAAFEIPFILGGAELYVTASVGISICPRDGEDFTTLVKNADAAMYKAKETGRNNFQFFRTSLMETAAERVLLSSHLRRAIEQQQLLIYFQPQVSIGDGMLVGVEALTRWIHPEFGAIPPQKFISVAEETGYIRTLSEWITEQALTQWQSHVKLLQSGLIPRLSVNVSSVQFQQQNLYAWITDLLDKSGVEPQHLELEITESILMQDVDKAHAVLTDLDRLGVRIALDDFGTGYSSLSYLARFPIHTVKIDRAFIKNITQDEKQLRLVRAINRLGQDMGLNVVAEGVETESQLALLKEMGCNLIQGFIFSHPKPPEELAGWLGRGREYRLGIRGGN